MFFYKTEITLGLSYWEHKTWVSTIDFAIIGSGIVGLTSALQLKNKYPKTNIVVFERGILPNGASTKNAGFGCFGSISELLDDLKTHTEAEVISLVARRWEGLQLLRKNLGDKNIDYQSHGSYEIFKNNERELYEECILNISYINELLKESVFSKNDVFSLKNDIFSFKNTQKALIFNQFEGQLDTGKMMKTLLNQCFQKEINILNGITIETLFDDNKQVVLQAKDIGEISAKKVIIASNGFANQFLKNNIVIPARAQVLITKPISALKLKGTYHLDRGYFYFRNIDNRILLGGGRNLDFQGETTTVMETSSLIQKELEALLSSTIIPDTPYEIERRWTGIMGVGSSKKPIVQQQSENIFTGVRLGGMGVAIGSLIGKELANLVCETYG